MTMHWDSWQDFFAMGGYGLYIWGSVAVSFGLLAWEWSALRRRRRTALKGVVSRGLQGRKRDENAA